MHSQHLVDAYATPGRHYHTLAHVEDCLSQLRLIDGLDDHEREVLTQAFLWHDAVYDPRSSDNEEQSAALAVEHCAAAIRDDVARLILLTKSHAVDPGDKLGSIMIAIDLSILGAAPEIYSRYAAAIRQEYAHVPEADYRAGRAAILRRFLQRPEIYPYASIRHCLETAARRNIAQEISELER